MMEHDVKEMYDKQKLKAVEQLVGYTFEVGSLFAIGQSNDRSISEQSVAG